MVKQIIEFIISLFSSKKSEEKQTVEQPMLIKETPMSEAKPYLILEKEILRNVKAEDMPQEHQDNLKILLDRINQIRYAWGKPMSPTSGYRSKEDHIRIYKELAEQRKVDFDEKAIPWGSAHLKCAAVDISDPDGKLYDWAFANKPLLEQIGLWCEMKDDQPRVHFQIYAPKSGNRFFYP